MNSKNLYTGRITNNSNGDRYGDVLIVSPDGYVGTTVAAWDTTGRLLGVGVSHNMSMEGRHYHLPDIGELLDGYTIL
jgi:hypothetical protein